jgi:hypothetical protein
MSNRVNDIFNAMGNERALITQQVSAYRDYSQAEVFFRLAFEKSQRVNALRERFAGRRIGKVFVGASLAAAGLQLPGADIVALPKDYFERALGDGLPALLQELAGAIVVINNNDFSHGQSAPGIVRAYGQADDTIFLGWDYDNHHWMDASLMLAAHTDLYFPAHQENMFLLSRMNALTCGPVPCATVQWSQRFLEQHLDRMLQTERSDQPLGMHFFYQAFAFRNQTVVTLGKHYPNVGFRRPRVPGEDARGPTGRVDRPQGPRHRRRRLPRLASVRAPAGATATTCCAWTITSPARKDNIAHLLGNPHSRRCATT